MCLFCFALASAPPCTAGLDIGIVLDKSKSVGINNLKIIIKFLGDLIKKFHPAPEVDHFGLITFHKHSSLAFNFANSKYYNIDALLKRIAKEPITLKLQTRTDKALKLARDQLFTEAGGDRPDKPNVMIVLTDGKPTQQTKAEFKSFAEAISKEFKVCSFTKQFSEINSNAKPYDPTCDKLHHLSKIMTNFVRLSLF